MRAYEYLGLISEKEGNISKALSSYDAAFSISDRQNPSFGFKLASMYLKLGKGQEALDVANEIMENHPHYPRLHEEIVDRARSIVGSDRRGSPQEMFESQTRRKRWNLSGEWGYLEGVRWWRCMRDDPRMIIGCSTHEWLFHASCVTSSVNNTIK